MSIKALEDVDLEGLEIIEMRLPIDMNKLLPYLEANSTFPAGGAIVKQFNMGSSSPFQGILLLD
jgi:hypothetical protein